MRCRAIALVIVLATPAFADDNGEMPFNALVGPILGVHWGGGQPRGVAVGLEGGIGVAPLLRVNLGFEHRVDGMFYYGELDPWFAVGVSLGVGRDGSGRSEGIIGVWEGVPLRLPKNCAHEDELGGAATLALGYRYNGVHEVYVTLKAGVTEGMCFD